MSTSKWKNTEAAKEIIKRISSYRIEKDSKNVQGMRISRKGYKSSFYSIALDLYVSLLIEQYNFIDGIPSEIRHNIVFESIFFASDLDKFNLTIVSDFIKKASLDYINKESAEYCLLTKLNYTEIDRQIIIKTPNSQIKIRKTLPKNYISIVNHDIHKKSHFSVDDSDYCWVLVKVNARCEHSAVNTALSELNYFLGLINMCINFNRHRDSYGVPDPVNVIIKRPFHVLYSQNELPEGLPLFESGFYQKIKPYRNKDNFKTALNFYKDVDRKISKTNRSSFFIDIFNRYVETLETNDMTKNFLSLWSILETLTFSQREKYDVTIERVALYFKDKFLVKNELQILREKRNLATHSGSQISSAESYIYRLLSYMHHYIFFLIEIMSYDLKDDEIREILDLPPNDKGLDRIETNLEKSIKNLKIRRRLFSS